MTRDELIEVLGGYEKAGWTIVALPPEVAPLIVGEPATQQRALRFMAELQREREAWKAATP